MTTLYQAAFVKADSPVEDSLAEKFSCELGKDIGITVYENADDFRKSGGFEALPSLCMIFISACWQYNDVMTAENVILARKIHEADPLLPIQGIDDTSNSDFKELKHSAPRLCYTIINLDNKPRYDAVKLENFNFGVSFQNNARNAEGYTPPAL